MKRLGEKKHDIFSFFDIKIESFTVKSRFVPHIFHLKGFYLIWSRSLCNVQSLQMHNVVLLPLHLRLHFLHHLKWKYDSEENEGLTRDSLNIFFEQGVQVLWSRRASSCQNRGGMGQRDKGLVSTVSTWQHFILQQTHSRHFIHLFIYFPFSLSCCSNKGTQELTVKAICCPFATFSLFKRTEDEYIPDAESLRQVKEQHMQPQTCSLAQCFQLYTKEEQVGRRGLLN